MRHRHLCVFLLLTIPLTFYAQKTFRAGILAGISTSQYDGDTYWGYHKLGLTGGGFVNTRLSDRLTLQFEIAYVQKGARQVPNTKSPAQYTLKLDYIEVPLVLKLNVRSFTAEANIGFGALVRQYEEAQYLVVTGMRPFDKTETSFGLGISYRLNDRIEVNWRWTYSLLPVRPYQSGAVHHFRRGECNNVFAYSLRYTFENNE